MAKLIREGGGGNRQVRRPDGHSEQYARSPRWRVRFVVSYPDGSRMVRSKLTPRKAEAGLLRTEANRVERLSKTGTATQQDLGHFLRLGLISRDDYLRLGGTQLDMSWDEVLSTYISSSYGRCRYFTHRNNAARAERIVAFLRERAAVARIADEDIRAYLTSRSTEVSKKTLKVELDVARQMLDYPVGRGVLRQPPWNLLMSANPARRVNGFESPIARTRFPRALSFEEDLQLLALVRDIEAAASVLAAAILLLRFYGLRRAELQYLTHEDLAGPTVLVQAKAVLPDVLGPSRRSTSPAGRHRSVIERRETRDQFKDGMWRVKIMRRGRSGFPQPAGTPTPGPWRESNRCCLPKPPAGSSSAVTARCIATPSRRRWRGCSIESIPISLPTACGTVLRRGLLDEASTLSASRT